MRRDRRRAGPRLHRRGALSAEAAAGGEVAAYGAGYVLAWARAFVVTEVVEAPVYRALARTSWPRGLAPSALTHPFVWFVFPRVGAALGLAYAAWVLAAEVFAVVAEAAFLRLTAPAVPWSRAATASLAANAASVVVGLVGRALVGAP